VSLNQLIEEHVTSVFLNINHFAELVIFNCPSGPLEITAQVFVDEPLRDDSGNRPTQYTGEIHIAEADVSKIARDGNYPLTVHAQGNKWLLVDSGNSSAGMRIFGIRRNERKLSNAVTLDGKQNRYGRISQEP
jgi:hypothetical protein